MQFEKLIRKSKDFTVTTHKKLQIVWDFMLIERQFFNKKLIILNTFLIERTYDIRV